MDCSAFIVYIVKCTYLLTIIRFLAINILLDGK